MIFFYLGGGAEEGGPMIIKKTCTYDIAYVGSLNHSVLDWSGRIT